MDECNRQAVATVVVLGYVETTMRSCREHAERAAKVNPHATATYDEDR
jgi:hypothetical protein